MSLGSSIKTLVFIVIHGRSPSTICRGGRSLYVILGKTLPWSRWRYFIFTTSSFCLSAHLGLEILEKIATSIRT